MRPTQKCIKVRNELISKTDSCVYRDSVTQIRDKLYAVYNFEQKRIPNL